MGALEKLTSLPLVRIYDPVVLALACECFSGLELLVMPQSDPSPLWHWASGRAQNFRGKSNPPLAGVVTELLSHCD